MNPAFNGPMLKVKNRYGEVVACTHSYPGLLTNKGKISRVGTYLIIIEKAGHELIYSSEYEDFPHVQQV